MKALEDDSDFRLKTLKENDMDNKDIEEIKTRLKVSFCILNFVIVCQTLPHGGNFFLVFLSSNKKDYTFWFLFIIIFGMFRYRISDEFIRPFPIYGNWPDNGYRYHTCGQPEPNF